MSQNRLAMEYRNLLRNLNPLTDQSIAKFGSAVQCRAGCGRCCHGLFDIGILDALTLHSAWAESEDRSSIEVRAEELLARLQTLVPAWRYPFDLQACSDEEVDVVLEHLGLVACPVLDSSQRCRLYDARPFYCRVHGLKIRDSGKQTDIDTDCELNFPQTPPKENWPEFDFSALFAAEGALVREFGLDPESKFLIPAVTTSRFAPIAAEILGTSERR
jgi:Fe-S-cluster containining protein